MKSSLKREAESTRKTRHGEKKTHVVLKDEACRLLHGDLVSMCSWSAHDQGDGVGIEKAKKKSYLLA